MNPDEWSMEVTRRDYERSKLIEAEEASETPEQTGWRLALARIHQSVHQAYDYQQAPVLLQWLAAARRGWRSPATLEMLLLRGLHKRIFKNVWTRTPDVRESGVSH